MSIPVRQLGANELSLRTFVNVYRWNNKFLLGEFFVLVFVRSLDVLILVHRTEEGSMGDLTGPFQICVGCLTKLCATAFC